MGGMFRLWGKETVIGRSGSCPDVVDGDEFSEVPAVPL